MSYRKLFWGVILIVIGVLFILKNIGVIYFDWSLILDLWPLLIILWGISIIPVHALIRLGLSVAAVLATFLLIDTSDFKGRMHGFWWDDDMNIHFDKEWDKEKDNTYEWGDTQQLTANYDGAENAYLDFDAGAGAFSIDGETDEYLAVFNKKGNVGRYYMTTKTKGNGQYIDFKLKEKNIDWNEENHNSVATLLNAEPLWEFDFDIGAAEIDFDLSPFRVKYIEIDGGAAEINVRLGDLYPSTKIDIDAGAADITLSIPEESGARLKASTFLSGKSLNGFQKRGDYYYTENYEDAENKFEISFDAAVSSIMIDRY